MFARFSYKNRQVLTAPSIDCGVTFCQSAGGPLQGPYNTPEIDEGMTFAHNYIITPKLLNEFRGGFNAQHTSTIPTSFSTAEILQETRSPVAGGSAGGDQWLHVSGRRRSHGPAQPNHSTAG
jgi:hypothetical protein